MSEQLNAMVLAAGRGERLRPLTDHCPKPLVEVAGQSLIEHLLDKLACAGVKRCVINLNWLGAQIREHLETNWRWPMQCVFSEEQGERLETGGGIYKVLDKLGPGPFIVANADVYSDFDMTRLAQRAAQWTTGELAHLVLVDNPEHNPQGDFGLTAAGLLSEAPPRKTFSGISLLQPHLFEGCSPGRFALAPLLRVALQQGLASAEHHSGLWTDVGTLERLSALRAQLDSAKSAPGV